MAKTSVTKLFLNYFLCDAGFCLKTYLEKVYTKKNMMEEYDSSTMMQSVLFYAGYGFVLYLPYILITRYRLFDCFVVCCVNEARHNIHSFRFLCVIFFDHYFWTLRYGTILLYRT